MEFIRARSDEQKNKRLEQIVQAALTLYETTPYEKITLAAIADQLDFTRANLYKYVTSKEEIFLLVILADLDGFAVDMIETFRDRQCQSVEEFAQLWSETLQRHERLMSLISILFTIIERNVSLEALAAFKKQLYGELNRFGPLLVQQFPAMSPQQLETFLNMQIHYAAGLYPCTQLTEIQREAVQLSGIDYEILDFVTVFSRFVVTVLKGMELA